MTERKVDPITLEILSHKMWQVADEAGITVRRVSGSVVTIEAKDMIAALCDAEGNIIQCGVGVTCHSGIARFAVKHIMETYSESPGINDGDIFFANDPYICSMHASDGFVVTPIFYEGELVAWCITMTHLMDLAGVDPGGYCPNATEIFQEGLRTGGIKIAEAGKIKRDVMDFIAKMTRDPYLVELDLRAQVAAGNVAKRRVNEIIDRYGVDTFKEACREIIRYCEAKMRSRISELPDGAWQAAVYLDNDSKTDRARMVFVALTKEGDSLTFDYTGTDEEAPSFVNCGEVGGYGGVFGAFAPLMAYDMPWSQGILNPVTIIIPVGTVIRSKFPAPCSMGTLGGGFMASHAAVVAISKMLNSSEKCKNLDVTALWGAVSGLPILVGESQHGNFIVVQFMDMEAAGGGARPVRDGLDSGGHFFIPGGSCPNVETYEAAFPVLYLYRRQVIDSGGAGKFRGGVGGEWLATLHDAPKGEMIVNVFGYGTEGGLNQGICGGQPGASLRYKMVKDSDIKEKLKQGDIPKSIEEVEGTRVKVEVNKLFVWKNGDVFSFGWSGGGGYGDPVDRDPEAVRKDVVEKLVSPHSAEKIYGVVLDPETLCVNVKRTNQRRARIRKRRLTAPRAH